MSNRVLCSVTVLVMLLTSLFCTAVLAQTGWVPQNCPVEGQLRGVDFVDRNHGWVCGDSGTMLQTTDGGETWLQQELGTTLDVTDVDFFDTEHGFATGELHSIWRTTDGGLDWALVTQYPESPSYAAVHVIDAWTVWVTGNSGDYPPRASVLITTDAGSTWAGGSFSYNDGHPCSAGGVDVYGMTSETAFIGCAITRYDYSMYGLLFKTTDAGDSFEMLAQLPDPVQEVLFTGQSVGFYGPSGGLKRSSDGGGTWQSVPYGELLPDHMCFVDPETGWIAGAAGLIAATTDGGATWTEQESGTDLPLHKIQFVDPWVGTAVGYGTILHTITGGMSGAGVAGDPAARLLDLRAYPNPSPGMVRIVFQASGTAPEPIDIFDASGRAIRTLYGRADVTWDGRDEAGRAAKPGAYFIRLGDTGAERSLRITIAGR